MKLVRRSVLVAFIVIVGFGIGAWASQSVAPQPVNPVVLSGADIGFRMTGRGKGDTPVGELVVRVDGQWKPVEFAFGPRLISK